MTPSVFILDNPKCDMIKGNELDVRNIDFDLHVQAKIGDTNAYVFILF